MTTERDTSQVEFYLDARACAAALLAAAARIEGVR